MPVLQPMQRPALLREERRLSGVSREDSGEDREEGADPMSTLAPPEVTTDPTIDDGTDDPSARCHIVNQHLPGNSINDAMVFGTEVVALCGHRFIPYRRAEQFPVCRKCKTLLEATD